MVTNEEDWVLLCYSRHTSFHLPHFIHSQKHRAKELLHNSVHVQGEEETSLLRNFIVTFALAASHEKE